MRVLIEIVHPADVLFYRRPYQAFVERGDEVVVASRIKDVTCRLLDDLGIPHECLSSAGAGVIGLAKELVTREARLLRLARRFRPQVMLGFGGVAISHVGALLRVPTVVHYDHENAWIQTRLAWPFVTTLTVSEDYGGPTPAGRTRRIRGVKEFSNLHPTQFAPDRARALAAGLDPERRNVLLRLVNWGANHDIGRSGWSDAQVAAVIDALTPHAKVHVCSERAPPAAAAPHLWGGPPRDLHHLIGHCDAVLGESATIAAEAAALGAPALYAGCDFPGYTKRLAAEGLIRLVPPERRDTLPAEALALLSGREAYDAARARWLADAPDWAADVVETAGRFARAPW